MTHDNETVDITEFMEAIRRRRGYTYGWRTDYLKASGKTHIDIREWQRTGRVPRRAMEEVADLPFTSRKPGRS